MVKYPLGKGVDGKFDEIDLRLDKLESVVEDIILQKDNRVSPIPPEKAFRAKITRDNEVYESEDYGVWTKVTDKAKTDDEGKEPLAWLPWAAIDELSRVQVYGHGKYKDFSNYRKGMEVTRNLSCALRHIRDYLNGRDVDAESGHNPLAHAMCRIAFVLQNLHDGTALDDRYKKT